MPKITVITPTIRPDGLQIVSDALKKQTFKDFEWLVGSPFKPEQDNAIWVKDDFKDGFWSLNRIYNKLFKKARGKHVVSIQDHIWVPPTALERFLGALEGLVATEKTSKVVISGVGDQYERLGQYGKPEVKIWKDCRKRSDYGSLYEIFWNDAEFNWVIFPKNLVNLVGAFDQKLDFLGFGGDQLQFCERLNEVGVKFFIDQSNESFTLRHDRGDFGGQKEWDSKHVLFAKGKSGLSIYDERKMELVKNGNWPILKNNL